MEYLTMHELRVKRERLFDAVMAKDKRAIVRQTQWFVKLRDGLIAELKAEEKHYRSHQQEYFLELLEVAYVIHWRKQLKMAEDIIKFSDGVMRRTLGKR